MKLSEYRSNGREAHVFRAEDPKGLIGAHAALIAAALNPGEKIYYLLYSPIREAGATPFGVSAEPASHAVAVLKDRFLISKDLHISGIPQVVHTVPFKKVVNIELGNALLLGWLVIRFVENDTISCISLLYRTRGSHHFEAAIREYRKLSSKELLDPLPAQDTPWKIIWEDTPRSQVDLLKPLIFEGEKLIVKLHSSEIWSPGKRGSRKVCISTDGTLLLTDCGVIYAVNEQPMGPGILSFGVNICCIPPGVVKSAVQIEKKGYEDQLQILRLEIGRGPVNVYYDILADKNRDYSAEAAVDSLSLKNSQVRNT